MSKVLSAVFALLFTTIAYAAPSNDAFGAARLISGNAGSTTGTNVGATFQVDEPYHAGGGAEQSVWFKWTAPANGLYVFDTQGSNFDTILAVYSEATLLTLVEEGSAFGEIAYDYPARVYFTAIAATTYRIAVEGWYADTNWEGTYRLSWAKVPPPVNDLFANSTVLLGRRGSVAASNRVASKEPDEDGDPSGASIWYRFTALENGFLKLAEDDFTSINPVFSVYSGSALNALTEIFPEAPHARYPVEVGVTYHLMVDGALPGDTGDILFNFALTASNDNFATPKTLAGASGGLEDDNGGASVELNEPDHAGVGSAFSLWYLWTAPTSGPVWFSAKALPDGYAMDALSVYTGNSIATLVATASGAGRPLIFNAVAGSEYRIAVDTEAFGTPSAFRLSWLQAGPPLNDHLADAATLLGNSGQFTALLLGATQESAEITQFSALESADARSVWYRWTAPSNGVFVLQNMDPRTAANFHQVNGLGDYPFFPIAADNGAALTVGAITGQVLTFRVSADPLFVPQVGISYVFRANASAFKIGTGPRLRERLAESRMVTVIRNAGDFTQAATVTIAPTTGAGFAVVGTDFTLSPTTLIFAPGETAKVFTVTAINNATNSGNKMLHLNLTAGSNAVIITGLSAGEIIDDEDDPVNNLLSNATILSGQTGAASGTTIGADRDDSDPGYSPAPAVLAGAPDYTVWFQWTAPISGPVRFLAESEADIYDMMFVAFDGTTAVSDSNFGTIGWLAEAGKTYSIAMSLSELDNVNYEVIGGAGFSMTWRFITAGIVNISSASLLEGPGATATLTLTRAGGTTAFQVQVSPSDLGSAVPGEDFPVSTQTVSFGVGETMKTVTVTILDDSQVEEPETFGLSLDTATNEVFLGKDAIVTIQDDDGGSSLSFAETSVDFAEDAGSVLLTVVRNGIQTGTASAEYAVIGRSGTGADIVLTPPSAVTFANGEASKIISIPITDDTLDEPYEYFTLMLLNPSSGTTIGTRASVQFGILDDDIPGVLALSAATFSVMENAPTVDIAVMRTNGSDGTVSATYTITPGTAIAGVDFSTLTGTVTFLDGETSKTFSVAILDDFVDEPNETFNVTLSTPTAGASLGVQQTAIVTLVDNDIPGTLAFSVTDFTATEGSANATLTLTRTTGTDGAISVNYTVAAGSALAGKDFTATPGTVNFTHGEASKSIFIPLLDDHFFESSETFSVTLNAPTAGAILGGLTTATVTITDDDTYAPRKSAYAALLINDGLVKGRVSVATTATGKVTAQAFIGGAKSTFKGAMTSTGSATLTFKKKGYPDQTLTLRLGGDLFDGNLLDGLGNVFTFSGNESDLGTKAAPVQNTGKFTALVQTRPALNGGLLAFGFPQGDGWLDITIAATGKAKLKGKLGDSTPLSFSAALDVTGALPVYVPLYAAKQGLIGFTLGFDDTQPQTDATATAVRWVKPRAPKDKLYPFGWPGGITADLIGSKFIAPAKVSAKNPTPPYLLGTHNVIGLNSPTDVMISFAGLSNDATVDAKNKVVVSTSTAKLSATLKTNGTFFGTFNHPANGKPTKFSGVVLQKTRTAGGYFIAPDATSAEVALAPKP